MVEQINREDLMNFRIILRKTALIQEHLESMQRDSFGIEFDAWKKEVDEIWKQIFKTITLLTDESQKIVLENIQDEWVSYITHYGVLDFNQDGG
ncbi:MAG: hypothetical protein ACJ0BB_02400 [Dehalococcoidia bacterium]|tara:strand:+ start:5353 stop:5634 length:282 start_codon:yes stop_codon:yes gene_type:complete